MAKIIKKSSVQAPTPTLEQVFANLSIDQLKKIIKETLDQEYIAEKVKSKAAINEARTEAETDIIQSLMLAMRRNDVKAVWIGAYYDYAMHKWVETIDQYSFGSGRTFSPSAEKHLERRLLVARQQTRLPIEAHKRPTGIDRSTWKWDQGDLNTVKSIILRYPQQPPQSMIAVVADQYLVSKDMAAEIVTKAYADIKQGNLVPAEVSARVKEPKLPTARSRVMVRKSSEPKRKFKK